MNDIQASKIDGLLERAELDGRSEKLLRQFFASISGQPQFDKIIDLLNKFPALLENFCKCFQLKKEFLDKGKSESEWNALLEREEDVLAQLD